MPWQSRPRIVVGADDTGYAYKEILKADLKNSSLVESVRDISVDADGHAPFPHVGITAGSIIAAGDADRALLVRGTGLGVAIAANKVPGIRAVMVHDSFSVERSVLSNNAQVLAFGQRVIGIDLARARLTYVFDQEPASAEKVRIRNGLGAAA